MEKPDVDSIDGLSPAVAIEQKNPTKTSRSTVGTATEIYDYLRLLWARIGRTFCPVCGRELKPDTVQSAVDAIVALPEGTRFAVAFPLRLSSKVTHEVVVENLRAQGFLRVSVDGRTVHLDDVARRRAEPNESPRSCSSSSTASRSAPTWGAEWRTRSGPHSAKETGIVSRCSRESGIGNHGSRRHARFPIP